MRACSKTLCILASLAAAAALTVTPAAAKCTRLAFSVNDYGKEGPTKDAKKLLDKYIAEWTGERGITGYRTGPKSVECELFLDFIVFDEYTCRAEATVCWDGDGSSSSQAASRTPATTPRNDAAAAPSESAKTETPPAASEPETPPPSATANAAEPTPGTTGSVTPVAQDAAPTGASAADAAAAAAAGGAGLLRDRPATDEYVGGGKGASIEKSAAIEKRSTISNGPGAVSDTTK